MQRGLAAIGTSVVAGSRTQDVEHALDALHAALEAATLEIVTEGQRAVGR
jgi:hypothetical protein